MTDAPNNQPAVPTTAPEAAARLNVLAADPKWTNRLFAGDGPAVQEFHQLSTLAASADTTDAIIDGTAPEPGMFETTWGNQLSARNRGMAIESLRMAGISDPVISDIFAGKPVSAVEYVAVQKFQRQRMSDSAWTAKLLAGDYEANRELTLISAVLAAGIKAEAS